MSDRELLEMAAKAAGIDGVMTQPFVGLQIRDGNLWNPLADDGDALRLAVALDLNVFQAGSSAYAMPSDGDGDIEIRISWHDPASKQAATRRAIVCAAAEIGMATQ